MIKNVSNNKASGPDFIAYLALKNLSLKAVVALINIINKITILQIVNSSKPNTVLMQIRTLDNQLLKLYLDSTNFYIQIRTR